MCIPCRRVCFSDAAALKLCRSKCVSVGQGLVIDGDRVRLEVSVAPAPSVEPAPSQPDPEVFVLPPVPLNLTQLTQDMTDVFSCAGVESLSPHPVAPFNWLDPSSLPPEVSQDTSAEPLGCGAMCADIVGR